MTLEIKDVKFIRVQRYPVIEVTINGKKARIPSEQKAFDDYGLVALIGDLSDVLPKKTIPADPGNGRPDDWEVEGFTDDPQIQDLFRVFRDSLDTGTFKPGRVDLGKLEF